MKRTLAVVIDCARRRQRRDCSRSRSRSINYDAVRRHHLRCRRAAKWLAWPPIRAGHVFVYARTGHAGGDARRRAHVLSRRLAACSSSIRPASS